MRSKFLLASAVALAIAATTAAIAHPPNGDPGVYLDDQGNVVGMFWVSCDGVFSYSGTRTSHPVTNWPPVPQPAVAAAARPGEPPGRRHRRRGWRSGGHL